MSRPAPEFLKPAARSVLPSAGYWWGGAALIGLLLALAVQVLAADRVRLAQDAQWRPWVERACVLMRCEVPLWHQPSAFRLSGRDIQPHPSVPGALLVRAGFRNTAPYAQAWPIIELSMSDIDQRRMGLRRFKVEDYLGGPPSTNTLAPGQSANLTLEIMDPGKRAVAFSFEFY